MQRADRMKAGREERIRRADEAAKKQAQKEKNARDAAAKQKDNGGWHARQKGWLADDNQEVTFKEGKSKENLDHTLITDGHKSSKQFDAGHDHYGEKREAPGTFVEDDDGYRGNYTGPNH